MARRLAATRGWRRYAGTESAPGLSVTSDEDVRAWARQTALGTYHPCGTCRMGAQQDPLAVVDNRGAVLGLERLVVADASVFPTIPAVNIHLSVLAVAHRLGAIWDH